ncbi:MAG: Jag N-terminal domain-containing protein [Campylobacterota bacterium]|nr:Jag N-terminal domain-containing protein [Campylobacterota bacterium]
MIKIEAITLEKAYEDAATALDCSITQLKIEVVQVPTKGIFGFFKKSAIIVAVTNVEVAKTENIATSVEEKVPTKTKEVKKAVKKEKKEEDNSHNMINDTIMPASFVSDQDDEEDDLGSGLDYTADYDDEFDETDSDVEDENSSLDMQNIATEVQEEINKLFELTCFSIEKVEVKPYDAETLLIEFKGDDAALLIGKEGYRYKALSYMIFNWINSKYEVQLRLEIAEFLKNQEESIGRYLSNVYESIERDGRAQTKILDGVLVQIALKELRNKYPDKYVVIRSTKDGLKYIIVNDYHNN